MLAINRNTEYALALINLLKDEKDFKSLSEIKKKTGLSYHFLSQVSCVLVGKKILESKEGFGGGYKLKKP